MSADEEAFIEVSAQRGSLTKTKTIALSLSDFDRAAAFLSKVAREWKESLVVYGRVAEEGFGIPPETSDLRSLVTKFGHLDEVDYLSLSVPGSFMVTFDFSKGEIRISSAEAEQLNKIEDGWKKVCQDISPSQELVQLALLIEAKSFVTRHTDQEGFLIEKQNERVGIGRAYYLTALKELGLTRMIEGFALKLVETQNEDGGWGREPGQESDLLSTANAILILGQADALDEERRTAARSSAAKFILSKRKRDGSWAVKHLPKVTATALCVQALTESGIRSTSLRKPISFIKRFLISEVGPERYDLVIVGFLRRGKIIGDRELLQIYELLASHAEKFVSEGNVVQIATLLGIASEIGRTTDHVVQSSMKTLISLRNSDGGWPSTRSSESELYPTVISMLVFDRLWKTKKQAEEE